MSPEVLAPEARAVLTALARTRLRLRYYLAGGTGLALQIGHRRSRDLDFFTLRPTQRLETQAVARVVADTFPASAYRVSFRSLEQIDFRVDGVKVTFLAYPFRLQAATLPIHGVQVAAVDDIAAMKAYTLGRRAAARDYLDLFSILRVGAVSLAGLITRAERMFQLEGERLFDPHLFVKQLAYTDDLQDRAAALRDMVDGSLRWTDVERSLTEAAAAWASAAVVAEPEPPPGRPR